LDEKFNILDEKYNLDEKFTKGSEKKSNGNVGNEWLNKSNLKTQWKALSIDYTDERNISG
jgi:hypothetical protein